MSFLVSTGSQAGTREPAPSQVRRWRLGVCQPEFILSITAGWLWENSGTPVRVCGVGVYSLHKAVASIDGGDTDLSVPSCKMGE